MRASDGGAPQVAPGVTIGGSGDQTSVSSGFGFGDSGFEDDGVVCAFML
jgi:hypothetical protein